MDIQEAVQYLSQTIDKRTKQGKAIQVLIKEVEKYRHVNSMWRRSYTKTKRSKTQY